MIAISVIIPTHNRAATLARTLKALETQTLDAYEYEVIVVADGCTDGTLPFLEGFRPMCQFRFLETPGRGPSTARNAGAFQASGEILLFLDDDMEADPKLVEAHLRAHGHYGDQVVLGHFPMQPPEPEDDAFTKSARLWWADEFAARSGPGYRFTFKDLCTGNVSMPRELFERIGGFDEAVDQRCAGEDYEIGYRLIQSGAKFQYVPEASSIHHTRTPLPVRIRRAQQEGFGQSVMVLRHPELFWQFNVSQLSRLAYSGWLRPLWVAIWKWPGLLAAPAAILEAWVGLLGRMEIYSLLWGFYRPLWGYHYWRGVRGALGSLGAWERLAQDAPVEPPGAHEVNIDLPDDLARLDYIASAQRVDAARIWCKGVPLGRIAPWAGAEPLTGEHIRSLLAQRFAGVLLGLMVENFPGAAESRPKELRTPAVMRGGE